MKRLVVMFFAAAMCLPIQKQAVPNAVAEDAPATQMEDMVVTATRTEEPAKDFPGRIEVITRQEINDMPVQTVDDVLGYISGAHVERTNGLTSHSTTVSLRGLGNVQGRTLVMIDGVPQNTADTGSVNWNRINLEDIKRIEVLKGPAAAVYGSNAMGGVINIITEKPTKHFQGSLKASFGTDEDWNLRGVAAGRAYEEPKGVYARVSARYHNNQGYQNVPANEAQSFTRKTFIDEQTINTKLGYDFNETNNVELQYTKDSQSIGEGTQYQVHNGNQRSYTTDAWQARFNASWEGWTAMLNTYFSDINYGRIKEKGVGAKYSNYDAKVNRKNYGIMSNLSRVWGPNTFTVGADYTGGAMDGTDYYRTPGYDFYTDCGKIWTISFFAQDQVRLLDDKLILLAGVRYDNATTYDGIYSTSNGKMAKYNEKYASKNWDAWSPRGSVKYFFMDNLSAYASYGRAFRAPDLDYMYRSGALGKGFSQISNPNLGPETIDSFEIGSDYQPTETLKLSGSAYHSIANDFMSSVQVSSKEKQYQNIGVVRIWGAELNAKYEPFKFMNYDIIKRLSFFANYTYTDSRISEFSGRPDLVGKLLPYVPQHAFNVGFNWLNHFINTRLDVQYVGRMFSDDLNDLPIDPHALLNGKLWRNLDFLGTYGEKFNVAFTVDNILDHRYYNSRSSLGSDYINDGRAMYLELSCKF